MYIDSGGNVDATIDDQRHIVSVANGLRLQSYVGNQWKGLEGSRLVGKR